MSDCYAILGVARYASQDDIRDAYRKLARELHPDHTGGDEKKAEKFKAVSGAYRTLMNPDERRAHDAALEGKGSPGERLLGVVEELLGPESSALCDSIRSEGINRKNFEEIARAFTQAAKITHGRMKERVSRATLAAEGKENDLFSIVSELLS